MTENAYLKQAFVNIALIPDGGLNWFLTQTVGYKLAYEMAIEGDNISASRCLDLGLTNKVVGDDELIQTATSWAESLATKSTQSLRETKRLMRAAMTASFEDVFKLEAEAQNSLMGSEDNTEAVTAFFEKRKPNFK